MPDFTAKENSNSTDQSQDNFLNFIFNSLKKRLKRFIISLGNKPRKFRILLFKILAKIKPFAPLPPTHAKALPTTPKHIIIMPPSYGIGDFLIFSPFVKYLKVRYNNAFIALMCAISCKDLAQNLLKSCVDEFIFIDTAQIFERQSLFYSLRFFRTLKSQKFDLCISPFADRYENDLKLISYINATAKVAPQNSLGHAHRRGFAKIKAKDDAYYTLLTPRKSEILFEFYRYGEFFKHIFGDDALPEMKIDANLLPNFESSLKFALKQNLDEKSPKQLLTEPFSVLFIGASAAFRKWSGENFAKIGAYLATKYDQHILICSGVEDFERGELVKNEILKMLENSSEFLPNLSQNSARNLGKNLQNLSKNKLILNLCGNTTLSQFGSILNRANLLVSNETSAAHFGAMLNTKLIVLYNGINFLRFCPYPKELSPHYNAIFHPYIANNPTHYAQISNDFKQISKLHLNINDISVKAVKNAVNEAFAEHKI